jgi:hypothetical protein
MTDDGATRCLCDGVIHAFFPTKYRAKIRDLSLRGMISYKNVLTSEINTEGHTEAKIGLLGHGVAAHE